MYKTITLKRVIQKEDSMSHFIGVWERFKDCVRVIPHHGFHKCKLISCFYEGVIPEKRLFTGSMYDNQFFDKGLKESWDYFCNTLTRKLIYFIIIIIIIITTIIIITI